MNNHQHRRHSWSSLGGLSISLLALSSVAISAAQLPVIADTHSMPRVAEGSYYTMQWLEPSLSVSSGYDTAADDIPDASGGLVTVEGKLGVNLRHERSNLMLQHDGQVVDSIDTGIGVQQYQRTSLVFADRASRSTSWSFLAENGYGSDAARDVGNLNTATLNTVKVPDTNTVAFGNVTGNTLTDRALLALDHQLTAVRTLSLGGDATFHHYFDQGVSDQRYSVNLGLRTDLRNDITVGVRAEGVRESYNHLDCTTASITAFTDLSFNRDTLLQGGIGPILGSAECSGNYQYNVTLSKSTMRGTTVYLGSTRQVSDGFVNQSTWETANFGGVSLGQTRTALINLDAGYAHYEIGNPTPANPNLHGYFVSGELRHRLSNDSELSLTARYFSRGPSPVELSRGVFLLTYRWAREERPTRTFDSGGR